MGRVSIAKGSHAAYYTRGQGRGRSAGRERSAGGRPMVLEESRERSAGEPTSYYHKAIGVDREPPGVWAGRGLGDLGLEAGAEVDAQVFETLFDQWVDPRKVAQAEQAAEAEIARRGLKPSGAAAKRVRAEHAERAAAEGLLGTAPYQFRPVKERLAEALAREPHADERRRAEIELKVRKTQRAANKYYDVTFSAPKSWSVLHAAFQVAGMHEEAEQVWRAMETANQTMLDYLQDHAGYVRVGHHTADVEGRSAGRWVRADRWIVASFRQHTSRDADPQLHIHNPILAKVRATYVDPTTGQEVTDWKAIDSKGIYRHAKAAEAMATRAGEEDLMRRLPGLRVAMRPDGKSREIVGISPELLESFSSRRRVVTEQVADLAAAYEERWGRPPGAHELAKMAQYSTLNSRKVKGDQQPTRDELLAEWEARTTQQFRESLAEVPDAVLGLGGEVAEAEPFEVDQVVARAVEAVQAERSEWTRADLAAQIQRHLPDCLGGLSAQQSRALIEELTETAVRPGGPVEVVGLTPPDVVEVPAEFRREDGSSQYSAPGAERFATAAHLRMEGRLVEAARTVGAPAVEAELVDQVVAGRGLNAAQDAAVRGIATSGRQMDVLIGPAGTGKSYAVSALCGVWEASGRTVLGVAPSQRAADVLAEEGIDTTCNLKKFLKAHGPEADASDLAYRVREGMLVVLDEAGMADTADLEAARRIAAAAGAKLLLAGDHHQIAPVGAGGMLGQLAEDLDRRVYELEEVRRFSAEWERAASLRIRQGDVEALLEYDRRGRLREGDAEAMAERAYQGWLADHRAGTESVLITPTNRLAGELAMRAREDLVRAGMVSAHGVRLGCNAEVEQVAGVGDRIALRKNNRRIRSDDGERWATNREVATVTETTAGGGLKVRYDDGRTATLPPAYVARHVELAYAGTIHSTQGRTVVTAHALVDGAMSREQLYVALTRGRDGNFGYVVCEAAELDELGASMSGGGEAVLHLSGERDEFGQPVPPDRWAVLERVMSTGGAPQTATQAMRAEFERVNNLAVLGRFWDDAGARLTYDRTVEALGAVLAPEEVERLAAAMSFGSLVRLVRHADERGHDGAALLAGVTGARDLHGLRDEGAGLHARLETELAAVEERQRRTAERLGLPDPRPGWRSYAERVPAGDTGIHRAMRVAAEVMDARVAELARRAADEQPAWAQRLGPVPEDPMERAEWEQRAGIVARYREAHGYDAEHDAIGAAPPRGAVEARAAWADAWVALGAPEEAREVEALPDAALREMVAEYERSMEWAPPNVDSELRETMLARDDYRVRADQLRIAQAAEIDPGRKGELAEQAAASEEFARMHAERAERLEVVMRGYDAWREHTADVRAQADVARAELDRRHPPAPQEVEPVEDVRAEHGQEHAAEAGRREHGQEHGADRVTEHHQEHAAEDIARQVEQAQQVEAERARGRTRSHMEQWAAEREWQAKAAEAAERGEEISEPRPSRPAPGQTHMEWAAQQAQQDRQQDRPAVAAEQDQEPAPQRGDRWAEIDRAVRTAKTALARVAQEQSRKAAERDAEEAARSADHVRRRQIEARQIEADGPQISYE